MKLFGFILALLSLATTSILAERFYTTDPNGELAPEAGYHFEEIACYVGKKQLSGTIPIYRWFNTQEGLHFYTASPTGEIAPELGYHYEGIAYYLYPTQAEGTVPFFRWSGALGHLYSITPADAASGGWTFEGVTGYVYPTEEGQFVPLYRWNNK